MSKAVEKGMEYLRKKGYADSIRTDMDKALRITHEQTLKEVEKKFKWQRCDFTDDKNMETMTITRFDWKEFKKEQGLK